MKNQAIRCDFFRILTQEGMEAIHKASLEVLEKTGFTVQHSAGLKLLESAGAEIEWDTRRVRISENLVKKCLSTVPSQITLGARNPNKDLLIGHGLLPVTRNGGGSDLTLDLKTDEVRPLNIQDLSDYFRLMDGLEHIDYIAPVYARDIPEVNRDVKVYEMLIANTDKHINMRAYSKKSLEIILEIATIVAGSKDNLKKRPILSILEAPVSPLTFPDVTVEALFLCGEYGIPLELCCMPIAGGTGPVTLAGNVMLANAEFLACTVISQLHCSGAPLIYAPRCMILDMKTTVGLTGTVEGAMMAAAAAQLARERYFVPVSLHGPWTDSILPDEQSNLERTYFTFLAGLAGTNIFSGAGMIEQGKTFSHLQLVIDDEIHAMIKLVLNGISTEEDHLGVDAIERVGPGGNFLTDKQTLKYFKSERFFPSLLLRETRSSWKSKGGISYRERARGKVFDILKNHHPNPLDQQAMKEISTIVERSEKILAG